MTTLFLIEICTAMAIVIWNFRHGAGELVAKAIDEFSLRAFVVGLILLILQSVANSL